MGKKPRNMPKWSPQEREEHEGSIERLEAVPSVRPGEESPSVPWSAPTPQERGRQAERRILKTVGARPHPNSGAGRIKHDGSNDDDIVEIKTAAKSHAVSLRYISEMHTLAAKQGKGAIIIIELGEQYRITGRIERL